MRGASTHCAIFAGTVLVACLTIPATAYADMGPPILWLAAGALVVLVVEAVVVAIEVPVLHRLLALSWPRAIGAALGGNAASALAGIPFGWSVGAATTNTLLSLPDSLVFPVAAVIIVLASFVASSLIEWPIVKLIARRDWRSSAIAVLVANALSHVAVLAIAIALNLVAAAGV